MKERSSKGDRSWDGEGAKEAWEERRVVTGGANIPYKNEELLKCDGYVPRWFVRKREGGKRRSGVRLACSIVSHRWYLYPPFWETCSQYLSKKACIIFGSPVDARHNYVCCSTHDTSRHRHHIPICSLRVSKLNRFWSRLPMYAVNIWERRGKGRRRRWMCGKEGWLIQSNRCDLPKPLHVLFFKTHGKIETPLATMNANQAQILHKGRRRRMEMDFTSTLPPFPKFFPSVGDPPCLAAHDLAAVVQTEITLDVFTLLSYLCARWDGDARNDKFLLYRYYSYFTYYSSSFAWNKTALL